MSLREAMVFTSGRVTVSLQKSAESGGYHYEVTTPKGSFKGELPETGAKPEHLALLAMVEADDPDNYPNEESEIAVGQYVNGVRNDSRYKWNNWIVTPGSEPKGARHLTTREPVVLSSTTTRRYRIRLLDHGQGQIALGITYKGAHAGGNEVQTWLAVDEDVGPRDLVRWFRKEMRGDHDAEEALAQGGFDSYGNGKGHGDAWTVDILGRGPDDRAFLLDDEPIEGTLAQFIADNDDAFEDDDIRALQSLKVGHEFRGGGGAGAEYVVKRVR